MKISNVLALVLLPAAALATPIPLEDREASPGYASYGSYPPPAGGYGKYSGYGSYKERRDAAGYGAYSGYGSYPPPAGGYGKYSGYGSYKRVADWVKSLWE
ncbi:uncharacterized protein LY89DRAFT_732499 [Mollisia scopiformis]|uniref:Uncharacterized protein n=1 Tax=Mollisia scopiformis TaxID=149040 RepID=A0A194XFM4_MOLSC|nr:uncharacterized protein LY89DRAFT_732499 [Mollisia scopiformis]KUJ18968.1 hypothetical protein LY89DRAFT_732499 [Mollisia scopiformis]